MSGETLDLAAATRCIERERESVDGWPVTNIPSVQIADARAATDKSLAALIAEVERLRETLSVAHDDAVYLRDVVAPALRECDTPLGACGAMSVEEIADRLDAAREPPMTERKRCERIEAALREALASITAGGVKDYFGTPMYDTLIQAEHVERWQAALAPVDEPR